MRRLIVASLLGLVVALGATSAWAQCGVSKTYGLKEVLLSADINASFTRTVTANIATCVTGYSASVTQMRSVTDPYPASTESLASTVADELARLRFQMQAVVGKSYWYQPVDVSLAKDVSKHWGATFTSYTWIADPAAPGAKNLALYAKDDGAGVTVLAYKDSNGIVNTLSGPSTSYGGAVTINFLARRNAGTPTTKLDVSADRISVAGYIKAPLALTLDATTTGANALDTGSFVASTVYYMWVIVNPTTNTFAGLLSTSETAPTMPTGYTKKRLVGAWATDAAVAFHDGVQKGREFVYATPAANFTMAAGGPSAVNFCVAIPNKTAKAASFSLRDTNAGGGGARATLIHWQTFTGSTTTPGSVAITANTPFARSNYLAFESLSPARIPMLNVTNTCTIYVQQMFDQVEIRVVGFEMEWPD